MRSKPNLSRIISVFDNKEIEDENMVGLDYGVGIVSLLEICRPT